MTLVGCGYSDRGEEVGGGVGGEDGDDGADDGGGDDGNDDGGDDGDDGSTGDDGGDDPTGDGGDDGDDGGTGDEEPPGCGDEIDCANPPPPNPSAGTLSHVPWGCESSESFELAWSVDLGNWIAQNGGGKNVPVAADLSGDGVLDIVLGARTGDSWLAFTGNGDGTFSSGAIRIPGSSDFIGGWGTDIGDLDGDGDYDLVAGDHLVGAQAWLNSGQGSFSLSRTGLPSSDAYSGAGFGDLDGDGALDAVFGADQGTAGLSVAFGNGDGTWTQEAVTGVPPHPGSGAPNLGHFQFHDFDLDGDLDMFACGVGYGTACVVYRNEDAGRTWTELDAVQGQGSAGIGWVNQASIGDVNCDGMVDIAAGGTIFLGNGTTWQQAAYVNNADSSHFGDMDGDGDLDLVTNGRDNGLELYLGDGTGTSWTRADVGLPGAPDDTPWGMEIADFDGNTVLDIARSLDANNSTVLEVWTR
jgi:hypothetical protein